MINQIAQASAEQAEGVSQVHTAISDIDGATQQNAALVEQTSAAAESMSEQATELSRNMSFFKTGASNLQRAPKAQIAAAKPTALSAPQAIKQSGSLNKPVSNEVLNKPVKKDDDEWADF